FAVDFPRHEVTFNGKTPRGGYVIDGGPDTLYYSYAVSVPKEFGSLPVAAFPTGGSVQAAAPSSNPTSTAAKMEEGVVEEVASISVLCRDQPDHGANEAASHRVGYGSEYNRHSVALLS